MTSTDTRILTEAADRIEKEIRCQTHAEAHGVRNAIDLVRRMAAEAQPDTTNRSVVTDRVLSDVLAERVRQDEKWGEQNHPDGTGGSGALYVADRYRTVVDHGLADGTATWRDVLLEEVYEALAEPDPTRLRAELVQIAAVAAAWIEAIDRRTAAPAVVPAR